jgi:P4 family phage/plasmid primase-like protien
VDSRDSKQFSVYREGRWERGGGEVPAEATTVLLHNRFRVSHLNNVVSVLRFRPGVRRIDGSPTPRWINVPNGLLDWRTRELHPHTPDVLSTVQLPVRWDPAADCPAFEQFLGEVLPADCLAPADGGPGFIWELLGYCLYSGNPHHVAVLLFGNGRNGKGALLRVLGRLAGARNTSSVPLHDLSENRFRAATLYGRLLNIAGDLDARWLANTATFKAITGGDTVQAEHK